MEKKIDAWGSDSITDYEHVFKEFGLKKFSKIQASELKHRFFEREIIIAHRDFEKIFSRIKSKKPFINMTGIASSGPYHLGHKVDIDLFKFFKDCGAKNLFAVCDLDAYCSRPKINELKTAKKIAAENIADALALGLESEDIYVQSRKPASYYSLAFEISKKITSSTNKAIYGEIDLGKISANLLQYSDILHGQLPEFFGKMPSITGIGLDQDPHARAVRDVVKRLPYGMEDPSFVYFKHQSGLMKDSKMSSSNPDTAIFLNDSPKEIERKIKKAFTGGRNTLEEHRKLGGVLAVDKVFELLVFHYPNSKELSKTAEEFSSGRMLSKEMKDLAIEFFQGMLKEHQRKTKEFLPKAKKIVFG